MIDWKNEMDGNYVHILCFLTSQEFQWEFQSEKQMNCGIFFTKIVLTYFQKKNSTDREFAKFLKSLDQFLETECFFNLFLEISHVN